MIETSKLQTMIDYKKKGEYDQLETIILLDNKFAPISQEARNEASKYVKLKTWEEVVEEGK